MLERWWKLCNGSMQTAKKIPAMKAAARAQRLRTCTWQNYRRCVSEAVVLSRSEEVR